VNIALLGFAPGGNNIPKDHPKFSVENGSAFTDEIWENHARGASPLQKQVTLLFRHLGIEYKNVLASNLVFFRSPSEDKLINKSQAIATCSEIWKEVFHRANPHLIITLGTTVFEAVYTLLNAKNIEEIPVHWGNVCARRANFNGNKKLVGLPQLSRFKIIGRSQSETALEELFKGYWLKK
jgi:uracil-DNA glycosylase